MKQTLQRIRLLYEISMSIGSGTEFQEILKGSLQVLIGKLKLTAGVIYRYAESSVSGFSEVCTLTSDMHCNIASTEVYKEADRLIHSSGFISRFGLSKSGLVCSGTTHGSSYHVFGLKGFGIICLFQHGTGEYPDIMDSLAPVLDRLADSCLLCIRNDELKESSEKVTSMNEALRDRTADLEISRTALMNIMCDMEQTQKSLRLLEEAIRNMRTGITFCGLDRRILYTNPADAKMHGYEAQELIGMDTGLFALQGTEKTLSAVDIESITTWARESVNVRKDGSRFPVYLISDVVRDEGGRPIGMVTVCEDITEKKKLEQERLKAQKLESLSVLAGGLAHDFNNILTAVANNMHLARLISGGDRRICEKLDAAERAIYKAMDLTHRLMTLSKGSSIDRQAHAVGDILKEYAVISLRGANAEVVYDIEDGTWPIYADEGQIGQVIGNLIINACQAMPEKGTLNVSACNYKADIQCRLPLKHGNYVKIIVKDSGVGISPEHMPRIFDPYFSTKQKGNGLGLTSAYAIAQKHGGYISVESELGAGSEFSVFIPAANPANDIHPSDKSADSHCRILIMDDDPEVRQSIGEVLMQYGYDVDFAKDGREAIELYSNAQGANNAFDIVIVDLIVKSGMGGREAVSELLNINPDLKAIVSSGNASDPIVSDYGRYGFSGVINKPFKADELGDVIRGMFQA